MKRWTIAAAAALAVATLANPSAVMAEEFCHSGPLSSKATTRAAGLGHEPNQGALTIGSGQAGSQTIYIDDRDYFSDTVDDTNAGNGIWIYIEGNNENFLQTGGVAAVDPLTLALGGDAGTDQCESPGDTHDTLIF